MSGNSSSSVSVWWRSRTCYFKRSWKWTSSRTVWTSSGKDTGVKSMAHPPHHRTSTTPDLLHPLFDWFSDYFCSSPSRSTYHCCYSAAALLALQTAVTSTGCLSVCLSVRHVSVFCPGEWRYDRAVSASGRTVILVSGEIKFILIFAGNHRQRGR